jgi:AraC family transcriptional regulator, arabinose operon regulatory protein
VFKLLPETIFHMNLYATPVDWQRDLFYSVARGGHLRAGTTHRVERETYPGHEFILCLGGRGWLRIAGKKHDVAAGSLVWVNCHHPHAYGAVTRDPWELYWLRIEGRPLDRIAELLQIRSQPIFERIDMSAVKRGFEHAFKAMIGTRPSDAALVNAAVAAIIGMMFDVRLSEPGMLQPELPPAVQRALERMRLNFHLPLRVAELAQLSGMSESHFGRQFKLAMGTSPIDWLRRERVNQAKRRLIESDDPVKEIARQTGYHDQFFFSKDFKRMTKLTPTQFREQERQS